MPHKLTQLDHRKLDMLLARYFDVRPSSDERAGRLAALTDSVKMCTHTVDLLDYTPLGDPARTHLLQSAMDLRRCTNLLARSITENTRDLAILIEPVRAVTYSLDARAKHADKVKYIRELAEITNSEFLQNQVDIRVADPWRSTCCWIWPTEETDTQVVIEYLISENIPYEFEAKSLLDAFRPHAPAATEDVPTAGE